MLKSVLYYLMFITTAVRFVDMIFLLTAGSTSLPIPVIAVSSAMILYGIVLVVKKFVSNLRLRQLMAFYMVQVVVVVFNLSYIAAFCPLQISVAETCVVGSFLDLIVDAGAIYACMKYMRSAYTPFVRVVSKERG